MQTETAVPHLREASCTARLLPQRPARPHTIASSRAPFWLRRRFAPQRLHTPPAPRPLEALDAPGLGAFLAQLAQDRGPSASRRKARWAALHSCLHDVARHAPQCGAVIPRGLAIPSKRAAPPPSAFGTRPAIEARLAAPEQAPWRGRRERPL